MRVAVVTLAGAILVCGCSYDFGFFGRNEPRQVGDRDATGTVRSEEQGFLTGLFTRTPIDLPDAVPVPMREATVERGYGGVILRVTGVAPTQGWFDAALLPDERPDAAGVLTVTLVAVPPLEPAQAGPERTRLLMTGAFLQELELREIRAFRVVAANQTVTLPLPARPAPPRVEPPPEEVDSSF
ncbi:hypothetical protein [Amaricoccus sp.]|uniref:hypothetical protein n=1 Tax=Amaricoccus sp. TaxID=1872485 RepID=UPI001B4F3E73|nr:hypothetical protein [Amaricoccus sp.]MBP7240839.1 hypothetical protein [Amaricoccus sp.]